MEIKPSKELAYWVGVVQSDGCLYGNRIYLGVKSRSFPMLEKFAEISKIIFRTNNQIRQRSKSEPGVRCFRFTVSKFISQLKNLDIKFGDPPKPPLWVTKKSEFFGAYLAGIIDGDGSIRIKRKKYPQCMVKITSGKRQDKLATSIKNFLNCAVSITSYKKDKILDGRIIKGKWYELEFLVSSKNCRFVKLYILPHLTIIHKKEILEEYILERFGM